MNITIKKLSLRNFKGIREFEVRFTEKETNIYGANATGKTTLMDAFLWLFFDKNSADRKDFNIKTLDGNNKPFRKLEHEVSAIIDVDGQNISLKKVYKEKWVKKHGEITPEFSGHDTSYYWNEVPMKQKEFDQKVANLFNESLFKLITNTTYFNSLKWQDRRVVLMNIAGHISNEDVLNSIRTVSNKTQTGIIIDALNKGKSIEEFAKEISSKKKKLKDDIVLIPSRLDEVNRAMPELLPYDAIEREIADYGNDLTTLEGIMLDKSKAQQEAQNAVVRLMREKQDIHTRMMNIEFDEKTKVQQRKHERELNIRNKTRELLELKDDLVRSRKDYSLTKSEIDELVNRSNQLRTEWHTINDSKLEFNNDEFCCPTCKREYPIEEINDKKIELSNNFNKNKSDRIAEIDAKGLEIKSKLQDLNTKIDNIEAAGSQTKDAIAYLEKTISELEIEHNRLSENDMAELTKAIEENKLYTELKQQYDALDAKINAPKDIEDNSHLSNRKKDIIAAIDNLKTKLYTKELRERQEKRLLEIRDQEEIWNQELANLEGTEFTISEFTRAKMDMIEERINAKFKIVKFKMFEEQINGGQVEACTTLVNGVPYSDVNTAGKIQAGVDIINTLSEHYNIYGPVWCDNRESVSTIPETKSQIINLIVSPQHKELTAKII